jgi:serine/threonine protein kinase/tetratricopeptide (TPR) repeat protein
VGDSQALAWLERLRTAGAEQRTRELQELLQLYPEMHGQVVQLLACAERTRECGVPMQAMRDSTEAPRVCVPLALGVGESVAGYCLLRELGRGGMSVVWLAERTDGIVKRAVALKLPLIALISTTQVERFARERDVLAALTHPNIARLYDAGVTQSGQPYMVLEFVDGMPITAYCGRHQLSVRARLHLYLQVLAAVEHAHQHLVVHRDLKPSNILVDAQGQVKLLDFGIAKLITDPDQASTASDLTQVGGFVLTPRYAAPEQLLGEPISTVTDVYVLGLVLHELLTGTLPHTNSALEQPSVARILDLRLNDETTLPSRAPMDATVAVARGATSVERLRATLSGDLDTIVSKALRRQRADRYSSVERYADDIRRFLADQPIAARPPSLLHATRLFLRRNRGVSIAVSILVVVAVLSALLVDQQRDLASEARIRAEVEAETAKQTTGFMVSLFNMTDPSEARGNSITAREIMDKGAARIDKELTAQPAIQATLMETIGAVYTSLGLYDQAVPLLRSALGRRRALYGGKHVDVARSMDRLCEALKLKAEYEAAQRMCREALTLRRELLGNEHADTARSGYELADLLGRKGEFAEAEPLFREALTLRKKLFEARSPEVAQSLEGLALNLYDQGNFRDSEALLREAVTMRRGLYDGPHPQLAEALNNLGFVIDETGKDKEAEQLYREALEMKRVLLGKDHPEIAIGLNNIAGALYEQHEYDAAEVYYQSALEMQRKLLPADHPDVAMTLNNLAFVTHDRGNLKAAIELSKTSLEMYRRAHGADHPSVARGMHNLALWTIESGDLASAERLLRKTLELRRKILGPEHADVANTMTLLAGVLVETRGYDEARSLAADARGLHLKSLGASHWRTACATNTEGAALAGLEQYTQAEALLLESHAVLHGDTSTQYYCLKNADRWLVRLYQTIGRPEQAAKHLPPAK